MYTKYPQFFVITNDLSLADKRSWKKIRQAITNIIVRSTYYVTKTYVNRVRRENVTRERAKYSCIVNQVTFKALTEVARKKRTSCTRVRRTT